MSIVSNLPRIGPGEKNAVPMLSDGERVGTGDGPACVIADHRGSTWHTGGAE
ncbi:hypothetical protein [Frondihabitans sucicola]|uniref:hypothetical protein n=1 Tax=Frondihabitans sucicola TaxID=1268041 RepID=UPI0025725BF7|nr:hypothetical protein [Frondihabitans sucicola]